MPIRRSCRAAIAARRHRCRLAVRASAEIETENAAGIARRRLSFSARIGRIFAPFQRIAGKPGDRVGAVFGAGHAPLPERYGAGFGVAVADPLAALPPASRPRC